MKPDLQSEQNSIKKMVEKGRSIRSIYIQLRQKVKLQAIGDYPLISFICQVINESGLELTKKAVTQVLKIAQDGEFKRVREDSEIVRQLCA